MLKITLITVGHKMPVWVNQAVSDFAKRLQEHVSFHLIEIPLIRRGKSHDLTRIIDKETTLMDASLPAQARIIALDQRGETFSSEQLAQKLEHLQHISSHLCLLIGGPEGLSEQILAKTHERWSLSKLTLPHTLARILVLETLYRAFSILHHHPYHK